MRKSLSKYKGSSTYQTRKLLRFKKEMEWIPQKKKSKKMEDLGGIIKIVKVAQLGPTLWDPINYTVNGILQARILQWVAFPFPRGSSQPRDWTQVSCIAGGFFTSWATTFYLISTAAMAKRICQNHLTDHLLSYRTHCSLGIELSQSIP